MAEGDNDQENKTEEPTFKRLDDARKKGQIPTSKEINTLFLFFALALCVGALSPYMSRNLVSALYPFLARPEDISADFGNLNVLLGHVLQETGLVMAIPFLMFVIAALSAGAMQTRFNVSLNNITPKLEKISIMKGFGRMFSMKSVVEFLKGLFKITIAGTVATIAVWPGLDYLQRMTDSDTRDISFILLMLTKRLLISIVIVMFLFAIIDYLYQRFVFMKSMRMTKQEVRDEYRQQEGDPMVKQKLKAIRAERSRKRMLANVPTADVVITNPTHFAVALKYDAGSMQAPVVVAKGMDKVAFRIREIAEEHKVMVLRNPPLARALFDNTDVDDTIPLEYYKAVAQVIGYVYKLKGRVLRPPSQKKN